MELKEIRDHLAAMQVEVITIEDGENQYNGKSIHVLRPAYQPPWIAVACAVMFTPEQIQHLKSNSSTDRTSFYARLKWALARRGVRFSLEFIQDEPSVVATISLHKIVDSDGFRRRDLRDAVDAIVDSVAMLRVLFEMEFSDEQQLPKLF